VTRKEREALAMVVLSVVSTRPSAVRHVADALRDEIARVDAATTTARHIAATLPTRISRLQMLQMP